MEFFGCNELGSRAAAFFRGDAIPSKVAMQTWLHVFAPDIQLERTSQEEQNNWKGCAKGCVLEQVDITHYYDYVPHSKLAIETRVPVVSRFCELAEYQESDEVSRSYQFIETRWRGFSDQNGSWQWPWESIRFDVGDTTYISRGNFSLQEQLDARFSGGSAVYKFNISHVHENVFDKMGITHFLSLQLSELPEVRAGSEEKKKIAENPDSEIRYSHAVRSAFETYFVTDQSSNTDWVSAVLDLWTPGDLDGDGESYDPEDEIVITDTLSSWLDKKIDDRVSHRSHIFLLSVLLMNWNLKAGRHHWQSTTRRADAAAYIEAAGSFLGSLEGTASSADEGALLAHLSTTLNQTRASKELLSGEGTAATSSVAADRAQGPKDIKRPKRGRKINLAAEARATAALEEEQRKAREAREAAAQAEADALAQQKEADDAAAALEADQARLAADAARQAEEEAAQKKREEEARRREEEERLKSCAAKWDCKYPSDMNAWTLKKGERLCTVKELEERCPPPSK
ncbi:MAG: hypothetical protein A3I05_00260 [Deltaproteobacteria bacterium RIFCSPLOWO2_02_FULL_44_10]|nr:MAG: hypothetical protein A3C46_01125 [Deltaproteobacteria bacterium RIFCSPHIGHO2_02_FULL_44_16]OGQ47239.1 MAG: hypothetical protein A3I05_00260 [Deltaproteobacteria bacterium RIFCSPLOWO2_02_FULL_44_10]